MKSFNKLPAHFYSPTSQTIILITVIQATEMLLWGVEGEGPCAQGVQKYSNAMNKDTQNLTPSVFWLPSVNTVDPRCDCFFIKYRTTSSEWDITSSSSFWNLAAWTYTEHEEVFSPLTNLLKCPKVTNIWTILEYISQRITEQIC